MDALSQVLQRHHGRGAFLLRCLMAPPWSVRVADAAHLAVVVAVRGSLVAVPDGRAPVRIGEGDLALIRGPRPYLLADAPGTRPSAVIEPGQVCRALAPDAPRMLDARTWGNAVGNNAGASNATHDRAIESRATETTAFVTVTYELPAQVGGDVLAHLDDVVVVPAADLAGARLLAEEFARDEPGQDAVLDRLADVVTIAALRATFLRDPAAAPRWWRAGSDPVVGPALAAVHDDLARPWTVADLAGLAAVSRATFARRFAELVGEPPLAYLTRRRLAEAADLLTDTDLTLAAIARQVGYGSPYALSAAFSRRYGSSPSAWRERAPSAATPAG